MEYLGDVYNEFKSQIKTDPKHKSEQIRSFVRDFGDENFLDEANETAVYNAFIMEYPDIETEISRNYFHTVISKGFKTIKGPIGTIIKISDQIYIKGRIKQSIE
jgi:hypothetical protein